MAIIKSRTKKQTSENDSSQTSWERDSFFTLINGIGDAVISTNQKGIILIYNAAALNLFDTNETLTGQDIGKLLNLYDEKDNPVNIMELITKSNGVLMRRDLAHKFEDSERINLYINMAPIRPNYQQNTGSGYILIMRDITREKSLEEERDEFISVVSHELRTPVTVAEGNLSNIKVILEQGNGQDMISSAVETAHDQILYLAKMINDLSTLSRAERGVADAPEDIDVKQLLSDLFKEYHPQAEQRGLKLNLNLDGRLGVVSASRLYLEEILQNFITNSLKYTKEGSVTIGAKLLDGLIELSVKDTGIGISKADQKHLFEKFFRSEDYRTRETNGTGLGLYVVRKLSHKLKIRVEVQSRLNHGSEFSFTLPVKD
jgi:two-component system, OmpR family, phosphate regulon sensor histidine kinase PhoR